MIYTLRNFALQMQPQKMEIILAPDNKLTLIETSITLFT